MARIVISPWMIRYPVGGILSWNLQWLVGFHDLGHEVYLFEKSGYPNACYDPVRQTVSDDPAYGLEVVGRLLAEYGMSGRIAYADMAGRYHGLSRAQAEGILASADLYIDLGNHGAWLEEAARAGARVLVDGEPGFRQIKLAQDPDAAERLSGYDIHYTNGANLGTPNCTAPLGRWRWRPLFNPVVPRLFPTRPVPPDAPFTTVMHWAAHQPVTFNGVTYGQKDVEFARFMDLPRHTAQPLEVAVGGGPVPLEQITEARWRVRRAHDVTDSFDAYRAYIAASKGEFSVCKNVFVAMRTGWFSDRSAAYLASGRPVVMQDTGFSGHLPCGRGLFAVRTVHDAAAALDALAADYDRHARAARELAHDLLATDRVLTRILADVGLGRRTLSHAAPAAQPA